jgi:Domain of unknown function (DUF4399)
MTFHFFKRTLTWSIYMPALKNSSIFLLSIVALLGALVTPSYAQNGPGVYFIEPKDGAKVPGTFTVKFGLEGKQIGSLGDLDPNKGHHHLIVDGKQVPLTQLVPFDDAHKHFGGGQTETNLSLSSGKHTLTLQFGDGAHRSFGDYPWSKTITIEVEAAKIAKLPIPAR